MQPSASPFPAYWWGTSLENAGLGEVRPVLGTYGQYAFHRLPSLPFELRGDFAWLVRAPLQDQHIGDEKGAENFQALASLQAAVNRRELQLPEPFTTFMATPGLQARVQSNTDCFLDLCPEPILAPLDDGYLIRFLADSQGCLFWYLYLSADGSDHAVVASPDFYGAEAEQWQNEPLDPDGIVFVAESFEAFICRFWLENEIWHAAWRQTAMPEGGQEYIERYRSRP